MDAAAYLKGQGWRGTGHSLDGQNRGLARPLLITHKQDALGVGINKHGKVSDQWWMRAFDESLKELGTGNKTTLSQIRENGLNRGGLYGFFVRGEGLQGTITDNSSVLSSKPTSGSTTPANEVVDTPATTPSESDKGKKEKKAKRKERADKEARKAKKVEKKLALEKRRKEKAEKAEKDKTTGPPAVAAHMPSTDAPSADGIHPERLRMMERAGNQATRPAAGARNSEVKRERGQRGGKFQKAKSERAAKRFGRNNGQDNPNMTVVSNTRSAPATKAAETPTGTATAADKAKNPQKEEKLDKKKAGKEQQAKDKDERKARKKEKRAATSKDKAESGNKTTADVPPTTVPVDLSSLSEKKMAQYTAKAAEKGISLETYVARRSDKKDKKKL